MDKKKYPHPDGELTIIWQPKKCIHSGVCVRMLPDVYHPKEKPWIQADKASVEALISQIKKCPSGALSFELKPNT
ncbi:MAG TPA: (4Fe-4S)-binding protein [Phnomibacter sp.]|nr:(4Fe-4S)-binding protein [Phnomibacter sp.]